MYNKTINKHKEDYKNRKRLQEFVVKKNKPDLYHDVYEFTSKYQDMRWNERLYMFFNKKLERPKCKYCGNEVEFLSISKGYKKFCSRKCINKYAKNDNSKKEKISNSLKERGSKNYERKYPNFKKKIHKHKGKYLIKDFCKHGDLIINTNTFENVYFRIKNGEYVFYCEKCNEEFIKKHKLSRKDKYENKKIIKNIKNSSLGQKNYVKRWFPKLYVDICEIPIQCSWNEKIALHKNNLIEFPNCKKDRCKNKVNYNFSMMQFNKYCNIHSNTSYKEYELSKFIENYFNIYKKYRDKNYELDVYIPSKNIGIEFNGLYWHGDKFKDKYYHFKKHKYFKDKNIKLINIWEDDWENKNKLVKSIIKNKSGVSENKIAARKCEIKDLKNTKEFLNKNHLQGWCQSSINLGLFYKNELISLMTFGKRKISGKTQYELLRFCNKLDTIVIGGASKLFSYFIKNYEFYKIISYANLDISDGNLYEQLGFINKGYTGVNYWWVKDKRYNRSNFMKHKLINEGYDSNKTEDQIMREQNFYKIWGTGNIKYEYSRSFYK